ncbi:MAG: hypothetical protein IKL84_00685 [Clostridia bacterium]|nr:hypothetical protein [Clostridia bacterium]
MGTTTSKNNRFRTVAKVDNRMLCPACPVAVERAVFVYDYALGEKLIQFVLRNRGDRPVSGAVVHFRCFDGAGNCLYAGDTPDYSITYTGQQCAPGALFSDRRAVKLSSYDIVNYEAWVIRVVYADGSTEEFSRRDYTVRPPRTMLAELLSPPQFKSLRRAWGKAACCVPMAINDTLWMCCCSAVCDGTVCPVCGSHKNLLAPLFGRDATLAYAKTLAKRRRRSKLLGLIALLVLVVGGIGGGGFYLMKVHYPAATAATTTRFLNEGRYDEALAFARHREDTAQEERVLSLARRAALEQYNYADALMYDALMQEPDPEGIYRVAAERALAGMQASLIDFTAAGYGLLTGDEALYDQLIRALIDYCEAREMYRQAASYTRLLHNMGDAALKQVFDDAIADSLARNSYEEAISWAEMHPDPARITEVINNIFSKLLFEDVDYERALDLLNYADGDRYIKLLEKTVGDEFIRTHIGYFYFRFTEKEKREYHAQPLAVCKEAAYIAADGRVHGLAGVQWTDAVSLSANTFHTLCLKSDGRVLAAGDTAFGRCSVSSWTNVVSVAAGERHSVALLANGNVAAVGDNGEGQCEVAGWRNIVDIAAGKSHTVGLRADGRVLAVGSNASGQCDVSGYENVIAVAAGDWTTVLLHGDGHVSVLGNTALGIADANAWTEIVAIAGGSSHVMGLRADGTVLMAGRPVEGDAGSTAEWQDVTAIAAGSACVAGLRADGTLLISGAGAPVPN